MKSQEMKFFRWVRPDFMVVTLLLFITVFLVGLVSFNMSFFNPIEKALTDFNFSDLLYSKLSSKEELLDTNIVLVNISHLDRKQIARQIKRVKSYHPRIIGFDGFFSALRDSAIDAELEGSLKLDHNLAMACYLTGKNAADGEYDSLETSFPYFNSGIRGYVNLGGGNPETSTVRTFSAFQVFKGDTLFAMAAEMVRKYNPPAFCRLIKRNNDREIINYIGNRTAFVCYDAEEALDSTTDLSMLTNKIVFMGYIGPSFTVPKDLEDIYYTPMNPELAGRSRPDMYGVVIHANVASMILSENYINVMPIWLHILLSFIVCYFYVLFFTWFDHRHPNLFDMLFPLILLAINILLVYTFFILYKSCHYSINSSFFLVPVLLYKTFLTWYKRAIIVLNKKFNVHPFFLPPKQDL